MGNIIVSQSKIAQWRKESKQATDLLRLEGINPQEEQVINSVRREARLKFFLVVFLSATFSASIHRYFPETIITQNKMIYGLSCASIIVPIFTITSIQSNREIVSKLIQIKNNHDILRS